MGKKDDPTVSKPEMVRPPNIGAWDKEGSSVAINASSSRVSPPPLRTALAEGGDYIDGIESDELENGPQDADMQIPGAVSSPKKMEPEIIPFGSDDDERGNIADKNDEGGLEESKSASEGQTNQNENEHSREARGDSVKFNIPEENEFKNSPIFIPPIPRPASQGPSRPQSRSGHNTTISFKDDTEDAPMPPSFPEGDDPVEIIGNFPTGDLKQLERGKGFTNEEIYIPVSVARKQVHMIIEQFNTQKQQHSKDLETIILSFKESEQETKVYLESFVDKYMRQLSHVKDVYKREFVSFKEERESLKREIENLSQEKMSLLEGFNKSMEATKDEMATTESKTQEKESDMQRQSEAIIRVSQEKSAAQILDLSNQVMALERKLADANAKLILNQQNSKSDAPKDQNTSDEQASTDQPSHPSQVGMSMQISELSGQVEHMEAGRLVKDSIMETNELKKTKSSQNMDTSSAYNETNVSIEQISQTVIIQQHNLSEKVRELDELKQSIDKLKKELAMEKQTVSTLQSKIEAQNRSNQESTSMNQQLREETESKRAEIEQIKAEKEELLRQVDTLSNKIQVTNNFLHIGEPLPCMGSFISTISIESPDLKERIRLLQQIKQKINIQQNLCKSKIESMASQVKSEQDREFTLEEKESLRPLYEKYLISNGMVKCIGELAANLNQKSEYGHSSEQPQEAPTISQMEELQSIIKANEDESIEKEKAIDELKALVKNMKEDNQRLENELEKNRSEYQTKLAQLISERSSYEPSTETSEDTIQNLKEEVGNLRKKLDKTEQEYALLITQNKTTTILSFPNEEAVDPKADSLIAHTSEHLRDMPSHEDKTITPLAPGDEHSNLRVLISDLERQVRLLTEENNSFKLHQKRASSSSYHADDTSIVPADSSTDTKPHDIASDDSNELRQQIEKLKLELKQIKESKPEQQPPQPHQLNIEQESSLIKANIQIEELRKQLSALQPLADQKPEQIVRQGSGSLGNEVQSLKDQVKSLDEKLKMETTKSSELSKMLTTLQSQSSGSMKELPVSIVKSASQGQMSELENLRALQRNTTQELSRLEVLHQTESQQIVELKAQLLDLQQQSTNYQQTIEQQKNFISDLEKAQKDFSERMSSAGGNGEQVRELLELQSTVQSLKRENSLLKEGSEKNAARLQTADGLESKLTEMQLLLDHKSTNISLLEDKVKSAETTESMLRSEIENHKLTLKNAELQEETLRMQVKKLENATLEGFSGDAESQVIVSQLEALRQENENARSQNKLLQNELESVKLELLSQQQESEKLLNQSHNSQAETQALQTSLKAAQGLNEENNRKLVATQREKDLAYEKVALMENAQKSLESKVEVLSLQQNCFRNGLDATSEEIGSLLSRFRSMRIEPQFMMVQLQNLGGLLTGIKAELNSFVGSISGGNLDAKSVFRQSISLQQRLLVLDQELDFTKTQFLSIQLKKEDVKALVEAFTGGLDEAQDVILTFIGDLFEFRSASIGSSEKQPRIAKGGLSSQLLSKSTIFQVDEKYIYVDSNQLAIVSGPISQKSKETISVIDSLLSSVGKLDKDLSSASLDSPSSTSQSNALNQQLQYLQSQLQQLQGEKDEAKAEARKLQTESESLQKEVKQAKSEIENTSQKLSTEALEKTNLSTQLKAAKAEMETLNEKLNGIQAQLRSAESTTQTLENKLRQSQSETASLQTQLQNSHSQSDALQAQLKNSQAEVAKLQVTIGEIQSKASASEGQSEEFQKMVEERKKEIADLKVKFKKLLEASKTLEADKNKVISSQNEKMAALNTQIQESKDANTALTSTNKQMDEIILSLKNQIADEAAKNEQERQTLLLNHKQEIDTVTSNSAAEKEELNNKIKSVEDTSKKLKEAGKQLKGMVDQAKEKITNLEAQNKNLEEAKASLDQQLATANTNINELNATLSAAQKEGGEYKAKSEKLMEAATKLKEKLKQTSEKLKDSEAKVLEQEGTIQAQLKKIQEDALLLKELKEAKERCAKAEKESEELKAKFKDEQQIRKKIHNELEDVKGKIRVYCRIRPMSEKEKERACAQAVIPVDEFTVSVMKEGKGRNFTYDSIFSPWGEGSQDGIFEACKGLVQSAIDGYNVCIFAYGQTGSGKTFTMYGPTENPTLRGLAPRSMQEIFDLRAKNSRLYSMEVSCYMLELYRNSLVDLFVDPRVDKKDRPRLDIKKDPRGNVYVNGAIIKKADSMQELMSYLEKGNQCRHVASTSMNAESSRSHLVFSIILEVEIKETKKSFVGKLSLVDLAGSERVSKSEATAERLKEAQDINSSLSALGNVIAALSAGNGHIPYRDNKLTELMSDSLGGNAKTLMFVNVSPADYNADETIQSLSYASRVKLIKNDVSKGVETKEIKKFKDRLKQYEDIINQIKAGERVDISEIEKERDFGPIPNTADREKWKEMMDQEYNDESAKPR